MREIRVFVPGPLAPGAGVALPSQAAAHLARVLRLGVGAPLTAFDGTGGEYAATVERLAGAAVTIRLGAHRAVERESRLRVTLLQALARGEKMDWVLQKATELGVNRVLPVATERSVVQLDGERAARRLEHWQGIVAAACEQCGRNRLPEVLAPAPLVAACATLTTSPASVRLLLAPGASTTLAAAAGAAAAGDSEVALLIGPEGGLAAAEMRAATDAGFVPVALGPRVLRTETAAVAALSVLQLVAGDFGEP